MNTVQVTIEGIKLVMPTQLKDTWPDILLKDFKSYCGAGSGIGDLIVPERIFGLKVSHVCYIHDTMFDLSEATWGDFHYSNSIFLHNLIETIMTKSSTPQSRRLRLEHALNYYTAVDTIGSHIFWKQKGGRP